jgi:hypothetical protein
MVAAWTTQTHTHTHTPLCQQDSNLFVSYFKIKGHLAKK